MYKVKLNSLPDKLWIDESKGIIDLYALQFEQIHTGQIKFLKFNGFSYEFDEDVIAVPFIDRSKLLIPGLKLYYPKDFKLTGNGEVRLVIDNRNQDNLFIEKGQYLATLKLITTQFFNLQNKHDGSDKGLRSAYIKIIY